MFSSQNWRLQMSAVGCCSVDSVNSFLLSWQKRLVVSTRAERTQALQLSQCGGYLMDCTERRWSHFQGASHSTVPGQWFVLSCAPLFETRDCRESGPYFTSTNDLQSLNNAEISLNVGIAVTSVFLRNDDKVTIVRTIRLGAGHEQHNMKWPNWSLWKMWTENDEFSFLYLNLNLFLWIRLLDDAATLSNLTSWSIREVVYMNDHPPGRAWTRNSLSDTLFMVWLRVVPVITKVTSYSTCH